MMMFEKDLNLYLLLFFSQRETHLKSIASSDPYISIFVPSIDWSVRRMLSWSDHAFIVW